MANAEYRYGDPRLQKPVTRVIAPKAKARKKNSPLKRIRLALDKAGSDQVRERSGGRCEVTLPWPWLRCQRVAVHVHHMIGGRGKRGIGISALAEHKQHVCNQCHREIGGDVGGKKLHRIGGDVPLWSDHYSRTQPSSLPSTPQEPR